MSLAGSNAWALAWLQNTVDVHALIPTQYEKCSAYFFNMISVSGLAVKKLPPYFELTQSLRKSNTIANYESQEGSRLRPGPLRLTGVSFVLSAGLFATSKVKGGGSVSEHGPIVGRHGTFGTASRQVEINRSLA